MKDVPTVEIDMDKTCTKCGKKGATPSGMCIKCATDAIIGPRALVSRSIENAALQINNLMATHESEIHRAYVSTTEEKLSIGLTVELSPSKERPDTILVKAKIAFIESKIKDETTAQVSNQQKLPLDA